MLMAATSTAIPASVAGFLTIPIAYPPNASHILYARAHKSTKTKTNSKGKEKEITFPEGRTLFLVNIPPDATEREIMLLFKPSGTVERVVFDGDEDIEQMLQAEQEDEEMEEDSDEEHGQLEGEEDAQPRRKRKVLKGKAKPAAPPVVPLPTRSTRILRRTGRTAHVIFLDASSLSRALSPAPAAAKLKSRPWPVDSSTPHGLSHYATLYTALRPPLDVVKAHADSWIVAFEHAQAEKKHNSKYRKGEAQVDEDGFTLVARGGAYGQSVGGGVGVASKRFQDGSGAGKRHRKKKDPMEKDAFYKFQIHEKKRKGTCIFHLLTTAFSKIYHRLSV